MALLGQGLQDNNSQDSNQELSEEERAKLNKFVNIFQNKNDQDPPGKESQINALNNTNKLDQAQQQIDGQFYYFKDMNKIFKIYDKNSCYIFHGESWFRRMVVKLSCWPMFDNFIILLILLNSVMLALYDYTDRDSETTWNKTIDNIGNIFTYIFIGEAVIKIIAMGFFMHRNAYLRDYWNWLDFIVVCIGIVENIPGIPKLKALRTMRVLRPLRSVNAFPEMRRLIGSLLGSIPELGTAVVFLLFIFLLFGILGVQQFNGTLYQRCRIGNGPTYDEVTKKWSWEKAPGIDRLCSLTKDEGDFSCPDEYVCGSPTHSSALPKPMKLPEYMLESMMETEEYTNDELIAFDIANFNNLIWAMETIFVMITLEGWSGLMYNLTDASLQWMAIAFSILLVVVGSFFLLNVILAVIMDSFDKVDSMQGLIEQKKKEELAAQKRACGIVSDESKSSSDEEEMQQNNQELNLSQDVQQQPDLQPSKNNTMMGEDLAQDRSKMESQIEMTHLGKPQGSTDALEQTQNLKKDGLMVDPSIEQLLRDSQNESQTRKLLKDINDVNRSEEDECLQIDPKSLKQSGIKDKKEQATGKVEPQGQDVQAIDISQLNNIRNVDIDDEVPERARNNKVYLFFYRICMHDLFTFSMTAAILINTLVLALDQYPITYETQSYLEFVNSLLSYIFIVEMVIKVAGMGVKDYTSDSFNLFDGTIVFISIVEMIMEKVFDGGLGGGAFSSLRAVRLLRVFKLARSWTSFRELLAKMIVTLKDIQFFGALMILFLFIFTLLGMELFAYRVRYNNDDKETPVDDDFEEPYYPRASFNDFFTGFTTIFIVFIGEDWNSVMYDHARVQGDIINLTGTIVIFIFIFIVGNLIMLNLFLAILLKNFEEPPGKDNVEDTGPSALTIFRQLIAQRISQCCNCFSSSDNQVQDEKLVQEDSVKKPDLLKNLSPLGAEQNPITPISKKSPESVLVSERDTERKDDYQELFGTQTQDNITKPGLKAHFNTENKNQKDIEVESDDENSARKIAAEKKKMYQTKKSFSELKKTMLDQNINNKRSPDPKVLLRMKTMEQSQRSSKRFSISQIKQMEVMASEQPKAKAMIVTGKSLFLLGPENPIRKGAIKIVGHQHFDNVILFLIIFSTLMLVLETPLNDPNSEMSTNLGYIDNVVTALFTLELILKVIVMGFFLNGPQPTPQQLQSISTGSPKSKPEIQTAYIRNSWNVMDFIIVAFSLISIIFEDSGADLGAIKTLRMLRVLRPLRMISRNPGLKIAVNSLLNAIPFIGDVIVVSVLFLLLFGILCTNFFKGTLFSCQVNKDIIFSEEDLENDMPERAWTQLQDNINEHVNTKFECLDYGGEWVNTDSNFDNVGQSIISLFNVMTTEGWIDVMWSALDSSEIEHVPNDPQPFGLVVVFFLIIIFFFNLFLLNMFVGIVINVFSDEKQNLEMNHLLTQTELDWCEVLIYCYKSEPVQKFLITGNRIKDTCYSIAVNQFFDRFIIFCIIFNTGCLAFTWHGEPESIKAQLYYFNLVFNIIYTIEALIKLVAFDKDYFLDGWNNFDFIIVVAAWFGFITDELGLEIGASTNVIRIFRICRIFKIIKKFKSLRILFYTFIGAIPQLTNVGGLLLLFLFLYTVLGVEFFATVKLQENLTIHANFQTFGTALTTLFRMATGESWQAIMYDCARQKSVVFPCMEESNYKDMFQGKDQPLKIEGCGDPLKAMMFFVSFMVIVSFIFLNLFIAIILESFDTSKDEEGLQVGSDTISKFNDIWSNDDFDPKGTKFISIRKFPELLKLIIDEEIRQRLLYNEALRNGEIDYEDQLDGNKIFMFNIHSDVIILPIYLARRPKIYKKMIEDGDMDDPNQNSDMNNNAAANQENDEKEGGFEEMTMEQRKQRNDAVKQRQEDELFEKHINKFIATLEIPCYDRCTNFYYYDILEALSRHLFQQIIDQEREKLEEKNIKDSDTDSMSSLSKSSSQDFSVKDKAEGKSDKNKETENSDEVELTEREIEQREDILNGSLELILKKLEDKGAEHKEIEKYKEMRAWRQKRDKTARQQIESFDYQSRNGDKKKLIIDSSQLIGARIIMKYTENWIKKRREQKAQLAQLKQDQNAVASEQIEAKRDAKIMEKEILRKQRIAQKQMDRAMNEADKLNEELQSELRDGNKSRNQKGGHTGADMDNLEGDVSYLTVKDTEPGNKQGEDGPANLTANKNERRSSKKSQGVGSQPRQGMEMALDVSSFDEYNKQDSDDMQDIQSLSGL